MGSYGLKVLYFYSGPTTSIWSGSAAIEFPDGAIVYRNLIGSVNIYQFTYEKQKPSQIGSRLYYDIVHPTYWGEKRITIGRLQSGDICYSGIAKISARPLTVFTTKLS